MAHTNSTPNYFLPQFIPTDKPAWLTDINSAFTAIDTGMNNAQTKADTADNNAATAISNAAAASTAAATADGKGAGAVASLADAFDSTTIYSVGDYVTYNSLLYVCSVAVVTPGPWTGSANWTRATVEGIFNGLSGANIALGSSSDPTTITGAIGEKADITSVNNKFNNLVKYVETNVSFDSSGEGLLTSAERYVVGIKDITGGIYVSYVPYIVGTSTYVKCFNRSAQQFISNAVSTTRRVGYYYIDL